MQTLEPVQHPAPPVLRQQQSFGLDYEPQVAGTQQQGAGATAGAGYGLESEGLGNMGTTTASAGYGLESEGLGNVDGADGMASKALAALHTSQGQRSESGKQLWRRAQKRVQDKMVFIKVLGAMKANARASTLRELSIVPEHSYASAMLPMLHQSGTGLQRCTFKQRERKLQPEYCPSVSLTFLRALDVPDAGLERISSQVLMRVCLVENGRMLGNVVAVPGRQLTDAGGVPTWKFGDMLPGGKAAPDPYHCLVRSARKQGNRSLEIYIELNICPYASSSDEVPADSVADPGARRRPRVVDEITVAWGHCVFPEVMRNGSMEVDVQLQGASMDAPMRLTPSDLATRRAGSVWRRHTIKGKRLARGPTLTVKISAMTLKQSEMVNMLPTEMLCPPVLVPIMATYRELAAEHSRILAGDMYATHCSPVLKCLPMLLSDQGVAEELMSLWRRMTSKWTAKQMEERQRRQDMLEGLVLKFWPLLYAHGVPEQPISGNTVAIDHRQRVIKGYCEDHPVEALSRAPDDWLHRPFDVSEMSHNFGDPLAVYM